MISTVDLLELYSKFRLDNDNPQMLLSTPKVVFIRRCGLDGMPFRIYEFSHSAGQIARGGKFNILFAIIPDGFKSRYELVESGIDYSVSKVITESDMKFSLSMLEPTIRHQNPTLVIQDPIFPDRSVDYEDAIILYSIYLVILGLIQG